MDKWFYGTGAILDLGEVQAVYRREMDCAGGETWNTRVLLSRHDELVIADYDGAELEWQYHDRDSRCNQTKTGGIMPDVKETKELLTWALNTTLEAKDAYANGKLDLRDLDNLYRVLRSAPVAFNGAGNIVGEFWDMDDTERAELSAIVAEKLVAFGIDQSYVHEATDLILDALQANARVIRFFVTAQAAMAVAENAATKAADPGASRG